VKINLAFRDKGGRDHMTNTDGQEDQRDQPRRQGRGSGVGLQVIAHGDKDPRGTAPSVRPE
jgi:hypothetical protein